MPSGEREPQTLTLASVNWTRQLAIAAFTAILLSAVVLLGQIPYGAAGGEAVLRLALRAAHGKAEICRERSAEELEALPQHMRQPRLCEEVAPPYRLSVQVDGKDVLDEKIAPGGFRGDRPLVVDRQVEVAPGTVRLEIDFAPATDLRLDEALAQSGLELPSYTLDRETELVSDRITLVTLDDATGTLEIHDRK